jgi:hypothetical protein
MYSKNLLILSFCLFAIPALSCESLVTAQENPTRTVIDFLKDIGRGDFEGARDFVADDSQDQIQSWFNSMWFPDHETPPTPQNESDIDKFIGNFYKVSVDNQDDLLAVAMLTWSATDALIAFPSVADNPTVPPNARYRITLVNEAASEDAPPVWKISSLIPEPLAN